MVFAGLNYLAVPVAALAGFGVGALWYGVLFGRQWMAALDMTRDDMKPSLRPFVISFLSLLVMAWVLAGVLGHLGEVTVRNGVISAAFLWLGFVITTMATSYGYQGRKPLLTLIDGAHYLVVMVVMGAVLGTFGV